MTKQFNKHRQSFLLTKIPIIIVYGASGANFAQKADKKPKPEYS